MIDYEKYNPWVESQRKQPLMVVYKDGSKTTEELKDLSRRLKGYYFISDSQRLMRTICGLQVGGIIIEDGAEFKYENFRYALSRLVSKDDFFIFMMNDHHREMLGDILEEMQENALDKTWIETRLLSKIVFCPEPE